VARMAQDDREMKRLIHYSVYIPYTGEYARCLIDKPDSDIFPFRGTRVKARITCPACKKLARKKLEIWI
jgi:hypothetical protein